MASGVVLWHTSRATAVASIVLFSLVIILGVLVNQKGRLARLPRFGLTGMHRYLSLLAVALVLAHVATTVTDPLAYVSVAAVFLPFVSASQRPWIGLGAVAIDLFAAVIITSAIRQRIGHRRWQAIHWLVYAAWPVAVIHGLALGTDEQSGWIRRLTWGCAIVVGITLCWRLAAAARAVPRGRRVATILASIRPAPEHRPTLPDVGPGHQVAPRVAVPPARPPHGGAPVHMPPAPPRAGPPADDRDS